MKILFTTQALSIGGIEVLALRLSEAFAKAGHEIILYDFNPDYRNAGLVARYDTSKFKLAAFEPGALTNLFVWKIHALLFRVGLDQEFRSRVIDWHFARLLAREQPDIVCSLSFHQDYQACVHAAKLNIPVVVSMHGTYEYASPKWPAKARFIYDRVHAIIYAADKNMGWYQQQPYFRPELLTRKIYTGIDLNAPIIRTVSRSDLGLTADTFLFILVARGIQEKGWQEAIDAFKLLRDQHHNTTLLLVGEGTYLTQLRQEYSQEPGVIFYGSHSNSLELTALADVGLLPSYFPIETMPNVVIDYLRCGLPVLASDIGEIPNMLTLHDGQVAGAILVRQDEGKVSAKLLREQMEMMLNREYYRRKAQLATQAAQRFDLATCVERYIQVFQQVSHRNV